jgi:hypothetical protein
MQLILVSPSATTKLTDTFPIAIKNFSLLSVNDVPNISAYVMAAWHFCSKLSIFGMFFCIPKKKSKPLFSNLRVGPYTILVEYPPVFLVIQKCLLLFCYKLSIKYRANSSLLEEVKLMPFNITLKHSKYLSFSSDSINYSFYL